MSRTREIRQINPELSEVDASYMAGLVDSEGCINISSSQGRYYQVQVVIAQANESLLLTWAERVGLGTVHVMNKGHGKHSRSWQWHLRGQQAYQLLKRVEPYLILKTDEARMALEFVETCKMQESNFRGKGKPRLTEEMLRVRQWYKDALHGLKRDRKGAPVDRLSEHPIMDVEPLQMTLL